VTSIEDHEPAKDPAHAPGKQKRPLPRSAKGGKPEQTSAEATHIQQIGTQRSVKRLRRDRGRPPEHRLQGRRPGDPRKE